METLPDDPPAAEPVSINIEPLDPSLPALPDPMTILPPDNACPWPEDIFMEPPVIDRLFPATSEISPPTEDALDPTLN